MYGRKNQIRSHGRCEHCGKVGVQHSYEGRKWGHLYFIPIIPEGGRVRVVRECKSCRKGFHIPLENVPRLVESIQKTLIDAVVAIGAKENEMTVDGHSQAVVSVLSVNIRDAYCLAGESEVQLLLENLKLVKADNELLLAEAKMAEVRGDLKNAEAKFGELAGRSTHPIILYQAARFFHQQARLPEATGLGERVESMLPADLDVKQLLIECYMSRKEWAKLALTYENCFSIAPDLKQQKPIQKAYKKACKKAGREPQA
jgi:tetratricopeptide (TPR) repeat protein